ncbi:MAG: hypothetical protein C4336_02330 [Armatimonadota bacterium]
MIVGAGVMGVSVNRSMFGLKRVGVLDCADRLGVGSTSKATGGFRCRSLGEIWARLVLDMPLPFDISPLRPTRFAEGALNPETRVL